MRWKMLPGLLVLTGAFVALTDASACWRRGHSSCAPCPVETVVVPCAPALPGWPMPPGLPVFPVGPGDGGVKPPPPPPPGKTVTRLTAILVLEDSDKVDPLSELVKLNGQRFEKGLKLYLKDKVNVIVLDGEKGETTRKNILETLEKLKVEPTDGVLFYYAGHGAYDDAKKDEYFKVDARNEGEPLFRKDVLAKLEGKGRLRVVLSDACASVQNYIKQPRTQAKLYESDKVSHAFEHLFLETQGDYVANGAAVGQQAFYQEKTGGFYTFAILKEASEGDETIKDEKLTWSSFEKSVARRTDDLFQDALKIADGAGKAELEKQKTQTPETVIDTVKPYQPKTAGPEEAVGPPGRAVLTVRLPADATVTVDGTPTQSTGALRSYSSPELPPGRTFHYELRASVQRSGHAVEVTRRVPVRAGDDLTIDLTEELDRAAAEAEATTAEK